MRHAAKICPIDIFGKSNEAFVQIRLAGDEPSMPKRIKDPETLAFQKAVGERLMWVREISRHTQAKTSTMIGVSQPAYSKWENGDRATDPLRLLQFCARYQVSMNYIYQASMLGVHPDLAQVLMNAHPGLRQPTTGRVPDMDTLRRAYMAAIDQSVVPQPPTASP